MTNYECVRNGSTFQLTRRLVMNKKKEGRKLFFFFHTDRGEEKETNSVVFVLGGRPSYGSAKNGYRFGEFAALCANGA